jgi:SAM-dependent methyltransferase
VLHRGGVALLLPPVSSHSGANAAPREETASDEDPVKILGLPLSEHLPPPAAAVLLLGGDAALAASLARAGYRVDKHALDTGPVAERTGVPFRSPVIAWPFADGAFDAVILLDELAFTVREEEAIAEAARVLRPGGRLLLRVPANGPLAWLDGYNVYRYVWETTGRGRRLREAGGTGWRRHYRRDDVRQLLRPHFQVREMTGTGVGLTEVTRLGLLLAWRWLLASPRGERAIRRIARSISRVEARWSIAGRGYWLVASVERLAE